MATATTQGAPIGFERWQVFTTNSSGIPTGVAGTSPANNTTSSARLNKFNVTATFNSNDPDFVPFRGGDKILGNISFGGGDLTSITVECEGIDDTFDAVLTGANVDTTTNSEWVFSGINANSEALPTVGFIFSQKYQSKAAATNGQLQYRHAVVMASTVRIKPATMGYRGVNARQYIITPTKSSRLIHGVLVSSTQAWSDLEADHFYITTHNPIALTSYVADGTSTTFVTGYRPTSTVITLGANRNLHAKNGTAAALSSINATTGVATLAAAGSAGDLSVLAYETIFTAI